MLKLVELEADLLRGAALLVNRHDPLLEVHTGLDGAEHLVAGAENAIEEAEFLIKKLINPQVGGVAPVQEVDDHHIELLAVPVAPANPLLDALRVPRQVIIDDQVAELRVDPSAAASVAIMMAASSRKYSTRAARLSDVGEFVMLSVPALRSSQR